MARPKLVKLNIGGMAIIAKEAAMPSTDDPADVVCPYCAPIGTNMNPVADLVQWGIEHDHIITFFECSRCKQQVWIEYDLDVDDLKKESDDES